MIEIHVEQKSNGLLRTEMDGHAADEKGNIDRIVCASASTLAYTLAQCVLIAKNDGWLQNAPKAEVTDGHALVQAYPTDEHYNDVVALFRVYLIGVSMLERNFPQYVKVKTDISAITA